MGLLSRLFSSRSATSLNDPNTAITGENLQRAIWGGQEAEAGVTVNSFSAMQHATVFACVRIIAQTIASMPRELVERDEYGSEHEVLGHSMERMLRLEPCEYMSAYDFFVMMVALAEIRGNAYVSIERNGAGEPANLVPLISENVRPRRTDGRLYYDVTLMAAEGETQMVETIPAEDVIHIRGISLDGLVGRSPISSGKEAIGLSIAAEKYGARFFKNDAKPGVVLKHPKQLSDGAFTRLKEDWMSRYGGANQHSPAILEEGLEFEVIGIAPEAAQFLQTRQYQRQEIAALFGVPLSMLADPSAKTYGSAESDDLRFIKHTILPRVVAIETEFNRKLFKPGSKERFRLDFTRLQRGAFKDLMDALAKGVQSALLTPNEGRHLLGYPRKEGGDELFMQQNMAGAGAIADGTAGNKVTNAVDTGDTEGAIDAEQEPEE